MIFKHPSRRSHAEISVSLSHIHTHHHDHTTRLCNGLYFQGHRQSCWGSGDDALYLILSLGVEWSVRVLFQRLDNKQLIKRQKKSKILMAPSAKGPCWSYRQGLCRLCRLPSARHALLHSVNFRVFNVSNVERGSVVIQTQPKLLTIREGKASAWRKHLNRTPLQTGFHQYLMPPSLSAKCSTLFNVLNSVTSSSATVMIRTSRKISLSIKLYRSIALSFCSFFHKITALPNGTFCQL